MSRVGEDVSTHTACLATLSKGHMGPFAQSDGILILENGEVLEQT